MVLLRGKGMKDLKIGKIGEIVSGCSRIYHSDTKKLRFTKAFCGFGIYHGGTEARRKRESKERVIVSVNFELLSSTTQTLRK
jgi:hypothetical protein